MVEPSTALIVTGAVGAFCPCGYSVARASFTATMWWTDVKLAIFRSVLFALLIFGSLIISNTAGSELAAVFSCALAAVSLCAGLVLGFVWRRAEAEERRSLEDLRALVERYRKAEDSVEERCARAARAYDLTRREELVLSLVVAGRTHREIADELFVSSNTVKTHVRNLYRKMGVSGKAELVEVIEEHAEVN